MVDGISHTATVIIGAGQAGLVMGHELARRGLDYVILEESPRLGDSWRSRWDSLRLFTPAEHDGLPGLAFPAPRGTFPTKDEFAGYLESYAAAHELNVRLNTPVTGLARLGEGWQIDAGSGGLSARNVVVATGTNARPRVPSFATELDPGIVQLHSSAYHDTDSLPAGDVLVVGAGTSGAEIALELAATHRVSLSGRPTVHVPAVLLRRAGGLYWRFVNSVLTRDTPIGRKAAQGFGARGAPLIRISMDELDAAGVTRLPRVAGAVGGRPVLADGRSIPAASVVWATGYRPELDWIEDLPRQADGWPVQERGVVGSRPGLFFLGIPFQYALTSGLVGGVGRDAAYIADHIARLPRETAVVGPKTASEL
jgi:putative flavoprotein involved in K+ transport